MASPNAAATPSADPPPISEGMRQRNVAAAPAPPTPQQVGAAGDGDGDGDGAAPAEEVGMLGWLATLPIDLMCGNFDIILHHSARGSQL